MAIGPSCAYFLPELVLAAGVLLVVFVDLAGVGRRGDDVGVWPGNLALLTAGYLLWTLQRMYLGKPNEKYLTLPDISPRELFTLVPLGAIVIFLGIYPTPILNLQSPALLRLNEHVLAATSTPAQEMLATAPRQNLDLDR